MAVNNYSCPVLKNKSILIILEVLQLAVPHAFGCSSLCSEKLLQFVLKKCDAFLANMDLVC